MCQHPTGSGNTPSPGQAKLTNQARPRCQHLAQYRLGPHGFSVEPGVALTIQPEDFSNPLPFRLRPRDVFEPLHSRVVVEPRRFHLRHHPPFEGADLGPQDRVGMVLHRLDQTHESSAWSGWAGSRASIAATSHNPSERSIEKSS